MKTAKNLPKKINFKEKLDEDNLDLSLCSLDIIPIKEIAELAGKLKVLNLAYNRLTFLSEDFSTRLSFIRELDLSKNHLKALPENFGHLSNLRSLDLLGNQLVDLPTSFVELKNLRWLDLKDNPLDTELKKAVGECANQEQCKKCAINVIKYVKYKSALEERDRMNELQIKKEKEQQIIAQEKRMAEKLKEQKKEERDKRRVLMEQRRNEFNSDRQASQIYSQVNSTDTINSDKKFSSKVIGWIFLFISLLICVYIFTHSYCNILDMREFFSIYVKHANIEEILKFINEKVCPFTKNRYSIVERVSNLFNL